MLIIRDYRLIKIDNLNYSFDVLRAPEDKPQAPRKWIKSYKYYGTIKQALEGIKNDIIQAQLVNDYSIEEFIQMLEELQQAINNLEIKINIEK